MGVFLFGWATTGLVIYIRLFLILFFLILTSFIWSFFAIRGIQLTRSTRSFRTSVGKVFDERFDIVNLSRWACFWVEIQDNSTIPQNSGSRLLTGIDGHRQRSYTARTRITKRGKYYLGPTMISSGDPFGLFRSSRIIQPEASLIALPMTVDIPYYLTVKGLLPGGREIHQKTMDVTPHVTGVREYIPGDPMKRIHWSSTAKHNQFMVKVFEQDPEAEIWFFLDSQKKAHFSNQADEEEINQDDFIRYKLSKVKIPDDTYEYSISATASLVKYFLKQRKKVGFVNSGAQTNLIPAERGERQLGKVLETLAFLKPDGELPITGCVKMQAKYLPMGSGVILVTPSLANILMSVEELTWRKMHPIILLISSELIGGPVDSKDLIPEFERRDVPVLKIQCGENLGNQFSMMRVAM
jgi:uncharacterized protein (DUF58 family)